MRVFMLLANREYRRGDTALPRRGELREKKEGPPQNNAHGTPGPPPPAHARPMPPARDGAAAVLVLEAEASRCAGLRRQLVAAAAAKAARGESAEHENTALNKLLAQEQRVDKEMMQLIMTARRATLRDSKYA